MSDRWMRGGGGPRSTSGLRLWLSAIVVPLVVLVCGGLTACGGSSSPSTSTNAAAKTSAAAGSSAAATTSAAGAGTASAGTSTTGTSTSGAGTSGAGSGGTSTSPGTSPAGGPAGAAGRPFAARLATVRACLSKNGVTLPTRTPGSGGGLLGGAKGAPALPKGMTRTQYLEILKKCSGGLGSPRTFRGAHFRTSPVFQQALTKFAACMRQNGVNLPNPNTSGKGPVFTGKGIDTASPQFRQAEVKCRPVMVAALRSLRHPSGAAG
jgi:hypothetical protein